MTAEVSSAELPTQTSYHKWVPPSETEEQQPRARILVVDDENGPRQALRVLLKEEYDVRLASDVPAALRILDHEPINVVITDIRMPRQSGVDLLRIVRDTDPTIQVILLTGYAHLDTAMKAVEYGAFVYLEKPFDNETMLKYVQAGVEKNRREHERQIMEQLAIEANRFETLGRLVSGMMHDMGTPLSVIGGQIEMIMTNPARTDVIERLKTMYGQVKHCNDMVRSVMNFLRHEAQGITPFCLNNVVETCLEVGHPALRAHRVHAIKEFSPELASCMGDLVLVRQAILNLITNACHAMSHQSEPREITLRTWMEDDCVCLAVEDTGPGVPSEHHERIFETFFTTKGEMGTGLGLSVVRNVMRRHKGSVALVDKVGRGAVFVLRFPMATTAEVLHMFYQAQEDHRGPA
jgi:signal transduction histidine kinase